MSPLSKKIVFGTGVLKFAVVGLLLGSLAACGWLNAPSKSAFSYDVVVIAEGVGFMLQPPALHQPNESQLQRVRVSIGEDTHDLLVQVENTERHLIMVVLTTTGTRLATVKLESGVVSSEQLPALPKQFKAEQLLAAFQLSRRPLGDLVGALQGQGVSISESTTGAVKRVLAVGGEPVIEIAYSDKQQGPPQILYRHLQWRYQVDITTLEKHPL